MMEAFLKKDTVIEEHELIRRCIKLDSPACKQLYDQNSGWLFAVCMRYATDSEQAKDMLQEGFMQIYEKLNTYNGSGSFKGWMRRVVVNVALGYFRKPELKLNVVRMEEWHENGVLDESLLAAVDMEELAAFIKALPAGQRQVFNAFLIEGYSHQEIAQQMNISEGTSKSQLYDAKRALKEAIENNYAVAKKIV
ncbi:MAG: sigma-70 family RNA polymerase sigma factor [Bacteroidetes bacterium]|nr:sigma-70 family RNA polymerase sigma factor [Bacteroidota bacterium]